MSENKAKNVSDLEAALYVVATPIGNLRDITLRALDVLQGVDAILCEDTRTSGKLTQAHGITTPLQPYHEHNAARERPKILQRLQQGHKLALISDAGTPAISDPGYKLIKQAREQGSVVIPIPGASAAITALCASGLPSDAFYFEGFLPPKEQARRKAMQKLKSYPATLIFYESPKRLVAMLRDAATVYGEDHQAVVARELTKRFEEFKSAPLSHLINHYEQNPPKGEVVVLIHGAPTRQDWSEEEVDALLQDAMSNASVKDAAAQVAEMTGQPKRDLYQRALRLKV